MRVFFFFSTFMKKLFLFSAILSLTLPCPSLFTQTAPAADAPSSVSPEVSSDYILQPSDAIVINVFREPDLRQEVRITQENTVTLSLIGTIVIGGKTVRQAELLIRDLYQRDYLVNPQVTLMVVDYVKRMVNVIGQVNQPGPVLFPQEKGLTLMEAITRAGGFNRLAKKNRVKVTRVLPSGKTEVHVYDAEKIMSGKAPNPQLEVGDIVLIEEIVL